MATKKRPVPQRTCVICRQKFDKRQLTRLVQTPDGVFIDPSGKRDGRGAYICHSADCCRKAASSNVLNSALRTVLSDDDRRRIRDVAS